MSASSKVALLALRMLMTPELTPENAPAHKTVSTVEASLLSENWDLESPANSAVSVPTVFSYFATA